jgi:hypothetical protein
MSAPFSFVLLMILSAAHVIAVCAQVSLPDSADPLAEPDQPDRNETGHILWMNG